MNIYSELLEILSGFDKYKDELGNILKAKVQEDALNLNQDLIKAIFSSNNLSSVFFVKIDDIFVFDKVKFSWVFSNREFLPNNFTRFKNKIGLIDNTESFISTKADVFLSFPNKDCFLEFDSTKEKEERPEVFYNELLNKNDIDVLCEKKIFTNHQFYGIDMDDESKSNQELTNLVIKGNNLLVMHSLVSKYEGRFKCIYWDILYNTDNDKVPYNDSIKHSSWLTMMKNRVEVAKKLLANDGLFFIQCDKNEDAYLTVLMDEIFCGNDSKRSNHVATITVKSNSISGVKTAHKEKTILKNKDSILVYKKSDQVTISPQYEAKNFWDTHYNSILIKDKKGDLSISRLKDVCLEKKIITSEDIIDEGILKNKKFREFVIQNSDSIFRLVNSIKEDKKQESLSNPGKIISWQENDVLYHAINGSRLSMLSNTIGMINGKMEFVQLLGDLWTDIDFQNTQNEGDVSLTSGKKPEALIKRILELSTEPGDLVLDSYFGSGTTGCVSLKMGRKFIGIEQLDEHYEKAIKRLKNVVNGDKSGISSILDWKGGGFFNTVELKKLNQALIEEIQKSTEETIEALFNKIIKSPFLVYKVNVNEINKNVSSFRELTFYEKKSFLIEILDKNMLYVNYSEMDDINMCVTEDEKEFTKMFYGVK
jgi:adenine-specific DNA-methyltransferase